VMQPLNAFYQAYVFGSPSHRGCWTLVWICLGVRACARVRHRRD